MAKRVARGIYEVSPTETLFLKVSGPQDPLAALDDEILDISQGQLVPITPRMLSGQGSHHLISIVLLFPADNTPSAGYVIEVSDANGQIDRLTKPKADEDGSSKVQLIIRVV